MNPAVAAPAPSPVHPIVRWAFYLFVLSIPFDLPRNPLPVELPAVTASLFLLATLLQPSMCYRRIPGALWWFFAYLFLAALAFAANGGRHAPEVRNLILMILQLLLVCWAAYNLLQDERIADTAILTLIVACLLRAGLQFSGIGARVTQVKSGAPRLSALGQNADMTAGLWVVGLIAALHWSYARSQSAPLRRAAFALAVPILAIAIMQTGSRGALVALAAGVFAYLGARAAVAFRLRDVLIAAALLVLVAALAVTSETMRRRFEMSMEEGNLAGRERIYPELLNMYVEKPLLGWGPIANKYELALRLNERDRWRRIARREGMSLSLGQDPRWLKRDAHNVFLEVMTSTGTIGLLLFGSGVGLCVLAGWRARYGARGALPFAVLAAVLVFNLSEDRLVGKIEWFTLAYVLASGAAAVAPRPRRGRKSEAAPPVPAPAAWATSP